jgi:hypothetical protein
MTSNHDQHQQEHRHQQTGCAAGEVLGMVTGSAFGLHTAATVALPITPAWTPG